MRYLLDTSVLVAEDDPGDVEAAISAASLAELHFGVLVARDDEERARRVGRLAVIEASFDPLPLDAAVGREWGRLAQRLVARGRRPRRRTMGLIIAATANVHGAAVLTRNAADFEGVADRLASPPMAG